MGAFYSIRRLESRGPVLDVQPCPFLSGHCTAVGVNWERGVLTLVATESSGTPRPRVPRRSGVREFRPDLL
jgi:hypothetical protein